MTRDERQETREQCGKVGNGVSVRKKGYGYRELVVWQKGMELAKRIYRVTQKFPNEEKFVVSQMRRAAVSIPSNMAEGQARHTTK